MPTVKIATVAYEGTYDIELSLKQHLAQIEELASQGAELIVFPEISLQGYPPDNKKVWPAKLLEAYKTAELVPGGAGVTAILDKAAALGVHVIFGLTELGDAVGAVYNTVVLGGPDGYIGRFRKVHLGLTEAAIWRNGDDWPVFDTAIGKIGMLICYDILWPEASRELTLRGAEILVHCSASSSLMWEGDDADDDFEPTCRGSAAASVRAAENNRWFVSSNFGGFLGETKFMGQAKIVSPTGKVIAATDPDQPSVAIAEIDVKGGIAVANASLFGARLIRDRQDHTYKAIRGELPYAIDA